MAYISLNITEADLRAICNHVKAQNAMNKSDFVRQAIREKIARDGAKS